MPAIVFRCYCPYGSRKVECDSATTAGYAAKRAADAFDLDDKIAWRLREWLPPRRVLEDDEVMAPFAGKQLRLIPAPMD